ncbi:MAG: prepilin-type N-terminal cleavage/methylation domain-containing protein [Gemmatimonadetes bacterium]|nr:prepilin-type N-terminal cleavage/methylation domain-containing protein [Gemmatimonadota bacterium]
MSARRRVRGQDGFTLIEVLIAMVILAVGLLGLEALGIGAAKMVGRAERQGDYITAATTRLENTMAQLRQTGGAAPPALQTEEIPGAQLRTQAVANGRLWTVTVTVTPTSRQQANETYVLTGNVFR